MGARCSGRVVVSPWDQSRAVTGRRGDKGKRTGVTGGMRRRRGGAQRRGTTVLRHGLTLKPFEGEAVCASMDVNIGVTVKEVRVVFLHRREVETSCVACFYDFVCR